MKTFTIGWLNKCRCGNKSHTVKTARGNETVLWDDDAVKCNSCGRGGVIQVYEGQARVLWETDEEMAEGKPMSTITKERLLTIKRWRETYGPGSNVVLPVEEAEELARIALASLEQNVLSGNSPLIPGEVLFAIREVARIRADFDDFDGDRRGIGDCLDEAEQELIVTINKYASQLAAEQIAANDVREQTAVPPIQADVAQAIENLKQKLVECNRYNYCADAVKNVEDACHAAMLHGSQPVSQTYNLPELIEGMEVSIDVSTCDADLGNRYFGTVTEALELDTAKNGYILLVQDAEPNFDVNGNSPGAPDSWISCSERMPNDKQYVWCWGKSYGWTECDTFEGYYDCSRNKWWAVTDNGEEPASKVTHWMPLPEPPL